MSIVILALMYGGCRLSSTIRSNKNTVRDTVGIPLVIGNYNGPIINAYDQLSSGNPDTGGTASLETPVMVTSGGFSPAVVIVPVGGTVTWMNDDDAPHQPDADDGSSRNGFSASVAIDHDERYLFTFPVAGTVTYHDDRNPDLKGTVIVK